MANPSFEFIDRQLGRAHELATAALAAGQQVALKAEAPTAVRSLQKAQTTRAQAAESARPELVTFRRVVRATFGRSSKEYRSILDFQSRVKPSR